MTMKGLITSKILLGQATSTYRSPIARIWVLWSSFGAAHLYIAGCNAVEQQGSGVGSIRILNIHGNKIRETLQHIDPTIHSIAYSIADSPCFPATGALGLVQLRELGQNQTQITWKGYADSVVPGAEEPVKQQLATLYNDWIKKARINLEKVA
ncbi:hypothetical protein EDB81DRAFT_879311 [Dactylonectria macrodidyma]|uniref:Uncharacterized protein n=1 Tax=Dactylonectria macrodidyma TaxID=307937 RepID=A0A9P9JC04_9HYPO|nr:hypothetical protein EDB81DRAFT_879311 [Dactylonectria macrodidyma]